MYAYAYYIIHALMTTVDPKNMKTMDHALRDSFDRELPAFFSITKELLEKDYTMNITCDHAPSACQVHTRAFVCAFTRVLAFAHTA